MTKEVSIIIPTKNNGDILEKCLASIQNLDYPKDRYEVIVVDGHSTDDTVEIAEKYGCKVVYKCVGAVLSFVCCTRFNWRGVLFIFSKSSKDRG